MKFVSFKKDKKIFYGVIENDMIYDLHKLHSDIPKTMLEFIEGGSDQLNLAEKIIQENEPFINVKNVELLSPLINPPSVRDAYAFRQHVATARRNRGLEMIPEFDEIPIFYFTNHHAVYGEGDFEVLNDHQDKLDFESVS